MASDSGDPTSCGATTILAASSYHVIRIDGYSRSLNTQGNRPSFNSDPFRAGGRTWHVIYKPMGSRAARKTPSTSPSSLLSMTTSPTVRW